MVSDVVKTVPRREEERKREERSGKKYFERFTSCDLGSAARVLCAPPVKQDSLPCSSVRRQLQVSGDRENELRLPQSHRLLFSSYFQSYAFGRELMGLACQLSGSRPQLTKHVTMSEGSCVLMKCSQRCSEIPARPSRPHSHPAMSMKLSVPSNPPQSLSLSLYRQLSSVFPHVCRSSVLTSSLLTFPTSV